MPGWGRSGWTGRRAMPYAVTVAAALWFSPLTSTLSFADEGGGIVLARAVEPDELHRKPAVSPWGSASPDMSNPATRPPTAVWPPTGAGGAAQPSDDRLARKLVDWLLLTDPDEDQTFAEIADFIRTNPGWPRLGALRIKAERAITDDDSDGAILAWFQAYPPRTVEGAAAYARALERIGDTEEAASIVRRAWTEFDMPAEDEKAFLSRFGGYLKPEHDWARLDRLLWDNRRSAATRQMKRVDGDYRTLAEARLRLIRRKRNGSAAFASVPDRLAKDPGLIYEWVRWNRRKENNDVATAALLAFKGGQDHARKWWLERQILARRALLDDDPETAYRLVDEHGLDGGVARADAEFLAGWIALRFLGNARAAFGHFSDLYESVRYPISLARAAYWSGRAAEAAGEEQIARQWYSTAARHPTAFYGQLAARRIGAAAPPLPQQEPQVSPAARAEFDRLELVRAVRLFISLQKAAAAPADDASADPRGDPRQYLATVDEDRLLKPLLRDIARQSESAEQWTLAAQLARDSGRIDIAVNIARKAAVDGVVLGDLGYPTMALGDDMPPEAALLHALIRQESAFDVGARSRAGARGLMQLMPSTARRVARRLKVKGHSTARLTSDAYHNVALGSAYLESMLSRYEGSMIMALAAYNAGPHRVDKWIKDYGDPRGSLDASIDWIESLPFSETRNYVQRIMEALPIYRQKLTGSQVALLRAEDLAGSLPGYEPSDER